jgi:nitrite reductase (NO-forming)
MYKISIMVVLTALAVGLVSLSIDSTAIFAQTSTNTTISIVPGSSAPNNPKFYDPSPANITAGTTVTWINDDNTLHTVVSGSPTSGETSDFGSSTTFLAKGKTISHTFDSAGEFDYYCTLHPFMLGKVNVS